eukprot:CAMPEP_0174762752 /NCGR_PEP_ID=MMETSP1094-20130205/109937_1 /TAXON_ID=156173 /ORGANISM="Chrysochromulina brevifilum, Strain UTEX LB 985" /LENGTH=147 /DNA_ID=CAMNT_0015968709 /DNA_START=294 /DNA_END=737 /DNA_ORIENTATION=-
MPHAHATEGDPGGGPSSAARQQGARVVAATCASMPAAAALLIPAGRRAGLRLGCGAAHASKEASSMASSNMCIRGGGGLVEGLDQHAQIEVPRHKSGGGGGGGGGSTDKRRLSACRLANSMATGRWLAAPRNSAADAESPPAPVWPW